MKGGGDSLASLAQSISLNARSYPRLPFFAPKSAGKCLSSIFFSCVSAFFLQHNGSDFRTCNPLDPNVPARPANMKAPGRKGRMQRRAWLGHACTDFIFRAAQQHLPDFSSQQGCTDNLSHQRCKKAALQKCQPSSMNLRIFMQERKWSHQVS